MQQMYNIWAHTHICTHDRKFTTFEFWWINSLWVRKCLCNNDPYVCVSFHYLISCKYNGVRFTSCGLQIWKPYVQWGKLAVCRSIIYWNNVYRSAFRAVANGFGHRLENVCACVYVSVLSSRCSEKYDCMWMKKFKGRTDVSLIWIWVTWCRTAF